MSLDSATLCAESVRTEGPRAAQPFPPARCACLVALLLAEVLVLTLRFDTASLGKETGWWAQLLGQAHLAPRLALVVAAATLAFGGRRLRDELRVLAQP